METDKTLTNDQLEKLKESVRQRFDDLFHRIGTNRQKLASTVLVVHQALNKELAKEKIDTDREKAILREVKEIERMANNQLPHVRKIDVKITGASAPVQKPGANKAATNPKKKKI